MTSSRVLVAAVGWRGGGRRAWSGPEECIEDSRALSKVGFYYYFQHKLCVAYCDTGLYGAVVYFIIHSRCNKLLNEF